MSIDRQTIEESIAKYDWYQTIDLGNGVSTPGETGDSTRKKLDMMALPDDMSGMAVLDIGCNEGFFAFESERRGAAHVVAMDKSTVAMDKFMLVKSLLGSAADFLQVDLTAPEVERLGRFDIVFFLSVFHHLRHPFMALDRVARLTKGYAVMEFVEAVPIGEEDPSALVRKKSKKGHLHMLPTRKFLTEILQRSGFSRIEVLGTHRFHKIKQERDMPGFNEQRVLLKAYR